MAKKLKLGLIGMNEGNGHPYSWSAIFNGYNPLIMKECPFPAIPAYLEKQNFPHDSLNDIGKVTHIWTQDLNLSKHIASASNIEHVVDEMEEMISEIDAVLLARDDAENHYEMALPFLKAGLPVFIDKPLALTVFEAKRILAAQQYNDQIFTCSSIRYSTEIGLTDIERNKLGGIKHIEVSSPGLWNTYAVHLIESSIIQIPNRGKIQNVLSFGKNEMSFCAVEWENISAIYKVTGKIPCPVQITYFGQNGYIEKDFTDTFSCFKRSFQSFINVINGDEENIKREETLEIIQIIEKGRS